jgi:hypothetical protein
MTLSNFDWTDKSSMKWFILLPQGHEGPYSLDQLAQFHLKGKIKDEVKVWAEGLTEPVGLLKALRSGPQTSRPPLTQIESVPKVDPVVEEVSILSAADEVLEESAPPPLPVDDSSSASKAANEDKSQASQKSGFRSFLSLAINFFGVVILVLGGWFFMLKDELDLRRYPQMGPEIFERILTENTFRSWGEPIFFREYLAHDFSHIWLVTRSFHRCDVQATFTSLPEKLLSMDDQKIAFKSRGVLNSHIVELSAFDFLHGSRILPGMYEMEISASNCTWKNISSVVKNAFVPPQTNYEGKIKVILFPGTAESFQENLQNLLRKKLEIREKEISAEQLFWEDLQQKLQTLEAICLQIEQLFLDFLDEKPAQFSFNLSNMVQQYTKNYGSFLSTFVIENEKDFKSTSAERDSKKRNYETMIRLTAKKIGFDSMSYIEEFQKFKKAPLKKERLNLGDRVRQTYFSLKQDIGQKLSQVAEDRENSLSK